MLAGSRSEKWTKVDIVHPPTVHPQNRLRNLLFIWSFVPTGVLFLAGQVDIVHFCPPSQPTNQLCWADLQAQAPHKLTRPASSRADREKRVTQMTTTEEDAIMSTPVSWSICICCAGPSGFRSSRRIASSSPYPGCPRSLLRACPWWRRRFAATVTTGNRMCLRRAPRRAARQGRKRSGTVSAQCLYHVRGHGRQLPLVGVSQP